MRIEFALVALASWLALTSCITPNVLDSNARAVEVPVQQLAWRAPTSDDLAGLFESVEITGEAASALAKVYYHFAADRSYSGAALVVGGAQPEFQTLSGTWTLAGDQLDLGDGEKITLAAAEDHLRLASSGGVAVLKRVALQ
jgi:hypothetical protein